MNRLGVDNIEDAEIISEETVPLSDANNGFISWVARQADRITSGNRGSWMTEAIILADYAKDKDQLRAVYHQNQTAIDSYFEQVDIQKVIEDNGPDIQRQLSDGLEERVKHYAPYVLGGTAIVAGALIGIKKYKQSK